MTKTPEIIRGHVTCEGLAAADLELVLGEEQPRKHSVRDSFEMVLDDGGTLTVETEGSKLLGRNVELRGAFGDFAAEPLLAPFGVKAGPHVAVRLSGAAVRNGDEAALHGRWSPPDGTEGKRLFQADLIASGPEAEKLIAGEVGRIEKSRASTSRDAARLGFIRKSPWILYAIPAAALCFVYLGGFDGLRKLAISLLLTGAVFAARRRAVPRFHVLEQHDKETESPDEAASRWPAWDFILGCYIFIGIIGLVWGMVEAAAGLKWHFSPFLALVPAGAVLLHLRGRQGPDIRRLRALLRAPALPGDAADGAYGSAEGRLWCPAAGIKPGPVSCRWCSFATWDEGMGVGGSSTALLGRARQYLAVETGKMAIGLRHGQGALWASTHKTERRTCGWKQLGYNFADSKTDVEDYIPDGSRIIAAGRISRKGDRQAFSSEGTESTLIFASGKRDPRTAIRLTLAAYILAGWLLILAATAPGAGGLVKRADQRKAEGVLESTE